jgi:hypothetical protein
VIGRAVHLEMYGEAEEVIQGGEVVKGGGPMTGEEFERVKL